MESVDLEIDKLSKQFKQMSEQLNAQIAQLNAQKDALLLVKNKERDEKKKIIGERYAEQLRRYNVTVNTSCHLKSIVKAFEALQIEWISLETAKTMIEKCDKTIGALNRELGPNHYEFEERALNGVPLPAEISFCTNTP